MGFSMWDKVLSAVKDYHLPAMIGMFSIGAVLQWFHHLDMSFVAFTSAIIGGITGHAFSPAGKPDGGDQGQGVSK
jgi:5-formaminoimidazole-4-carboxamide-1-beta-D-ribofuranosyl 5'-monophosphate synthetase